MMKKQPTPLEILIAEQRRVRKNCRLQEQKINEDFKFIHDHSGRILFAGISSLFFSKRRKLTGKDEVGEREGKSSIQEMMLKNISPLLLEVALPVLMRWGMSKIGNLFKRRSK